MAADDVFKFAVTVPAGTPQAAPLVTFTQFRPSQVERISWRIPHGHMGVTGFQISMRGVQVIPKAAGQFIVGDGDAGSFDLAGYPDSGDWSVTAYNTGVNPHTFHIIYHIRTLRSVVEPFRLFRDDDLSTWPYGTVAVND